MRSQAAAKGIAELEGQSQKVKVQVERCCCSSDDNNKVVVLFIASNGGTLANTQTQTHMHTDREEMAHELLIVRRFEERQ